jgi:DNA-directed RNA polymerase alpha subunit
MVNQNPIEPIESKQGTTEVPARRRMVRSEQPGLAIRS